MKRCIQDFILDRHFRNGSEHFVHPRHLAKTQTETWAARSRTVQGVKS